MDNFLGEKICQLRTSKNITQEELASRIGVSRQAISKWERGEGLPDLYNIKALAKEFNVSVDSLMDEQHQQQETSFHNHHTNHTQNGNTGNYIKKLLYKAKNTTNSVEAKKIKKALIKYGIIGIVVGAAMTLFGFFSFATKAFNSVNSFDPGNTGSFNPIGYMIIFLLGGVVSGLSVYVLFGGLSIFVAEKATNYLDTRKKCPNCGDEIDEDEDVCSNCGFKLNKVIICECGKENQPGDKFCRKCGKPLK